MQLRKRISNEKLYAKKQFLYRVEASKPVKIKKRLPSNMLLFKNSLQTYILRNLMRKTQPPPPLVFEVDSKTARFFTENFSITKRYQNGDGILNFFNIKTYQFMNNCVNNNNTKYSIKPGSFKIRLSNKRSVKSTEENENGQIITSQIEKNQAISVTFIREMLCELTSSQKDLVKAFREEKLKKMNG